MNDVADPVRGVCECGELAFELRASPLFVHACHCLDCKRKTGSSFGVTCIVLEDDVVVVRGNLRQEKEHADGRATQVCARCAMPIYRTSAAFEAIAWVQTRSLEDLRQLQIGAHTWVKRKDPWLQLPKDVPQFEEGYVRESVWPEASIARIERHLERKGRAADV